jgi:hypothetical protein
MRAKIIERLAPDMGPDLGGEPAACSGLLAQRVGRIRPG